LTANDYENALFDNNVKRASYNKIAIDPRLGTAATKSTKRLTVNPIYIKLKVLDDLISIEPHSNTFGNI
jgi:hypothetical protein